MVSHPLPLPPSLTHTLCVLVYAERSQVEKTDGEKDKAMNLFNCAQRAHQNTLGKSEVGILEAVAN